MRSLLIAVSLVPSLLFFAWIERGGALPRIGGAHVWPFPWSGGAAWPLAARLAWDAGLFFSFGAAHSFLAQPRWRAPRPIYLAVAGVSLALVMALWQSSGVVLWASPGGWAWRSGGSLVLFWGFMAGAGASLARFGWREFLGFRPEAAPASPGALVTTGIYARVRHPVYLFTLLAIFVTPIMTLDRFWVGLLAGAYLAVAVPIEERKLVARFGSAYEAYRARVPAVWPRLRGGRAFNRS